MEAKEYMEKYKYPIAALLFIFIIAISIYVYVERDTIFLQVVKMQYADGCIETFHNDVLITPICEEGRRIEEENKIKYQSQTPWQINITLPK